MTRNASDQTIAHANYHPCMGVATRDGVVIYSTAMRIVGKSYLEKEVED